jgi:hypothetical protein
MLTEKDTELIMDFLKKNYPVVRIKDKDRFKRAILCDGGLTFFLNEKNAYVKIKIHLQVALKIVFNLQYEDGEIILNKFLNI